MSPQRNTIGFTLSAWGRTQRAPSRRVPRARCSFVATRLPPPRPTVGFTLLELMLALGLTTVILLVVGMAINLHLRSFDSRRKDLEQSQLAREILNIIANDIRSVVQDYEQDLSTLDQLVAQQAENAAAALGGGSASGTSGLDSGGAAEDSEFAGESSGDLIMEESTNTVDLASSVFFPTKLGIYGNQFELQVDVSRLPRFDEYQRMMAADPFDTIVDIPSDVKTVTYSVINSSMATSVASVESVAADISTSTDPDIVGRGLVRRQLDRAVAQYSLNNGLLTAADSTGDVVAAEVVSIEFQYFDGIEWRTEWDSEVEEGLPMAIEIVLLMQSARAMQQDAGNGALNVGSEFDVENLNYYRLLVPVAAGIAAAEEDSVSLEAAGI